MFYSPGFAQASKKPTAVAVGVGFGCKAGLGNSI
jgi:hypothetical protein